jgi:hypothetical protein
MSTIRRWMAFSAPLLSFLALILSGPREAAATSKSEACAETPRANILMIRKDGMALDPDKLVPLDPPGHFEATDGYINNIFSDLAKFCAEQKEQQPEQPCQLLFFFHGGLNTEAGSVKRARELACTIKRQHIYPIFVNWKSSLVSTWWDSVAHVHKGLWQDNRYIAAVPYFMAVDEVTSIAQAPTAWAAEVRHTFPHNQEAGPEVLHTYQEMVKASGGPDSVFLNNLTDPDHKGQPCGDGCWLRDDRKGGEIHWAQSHLLYSWWSKLLAPPLLIQAAGTGAWDMMQRRTAVLFRTEAEFRGISPDTVTESRTGEKPAKHAVSEEDKAVEAKEREKAKTYDTGAALAYFISRFQECFLPQFCATGKAPQACPKEEKEPKAHEEGATACKTRLEITLVGHSMGTIIVDRLLRYAPNLQVKNIVFMGAANTVEDYRDTVDAYLDRHKGDKGGGTDMYHLVLHPLAEVTEQGVLDLAPRGSLLIWIDNYFTNPPTPLGKRAGRFVNIVPELAFANHGTRSHVHLKVFQVGKDQRCSNPQKHGDFGDFPFWDKRFWDPKEKLDGTSPIRRLDGDGCPKEETVAVKEAKAAVP